MSIDNFRMNDYQWRFYTACQELDPRTLVVLMNSLNRGIDWTGCTKKDMLESLRINDHGILNKIDAKQVNRVHHIVKEIKHHKENISSINKIHRHHINVYIEQTTLT